MIFAGIAAPDQNFIYRLAFFLGGLHGDVGAGLVIDPTAVAMVTVGVNQYTAAGISGAHAARFAAESAKHDGMNHAQTRAGQHGDWQFRNHGHVNGDAIAFFQSGKITQQGGDLIHPAVEFLKGDGDGGFVFWLGDENQRRFVLMFSRWRSTQL